MSASNLPKPAQCHRVVVHNEHLGAYAVQQFVRNSSVYVEGDIELRVYNRGVTVETVKVPQSCVGYDGTTRQWVSATGTTETTRAPDLSRWKSGTTDIQM